MLRQSALAFAILPLLASSVLADGRQDWAGYGWQKLDLSACQSATDGWACPPIQEKWDWKRNQWVAVSVSAKGRTLHLTQQLTNNDRRDDDFVCVTVLLLDADGRTLLAHHQNWHSDPASIDTRDFSYTSSVLGRTATIHLGSKQCRKGAHQDDDTYARVQSTLPR